MTVMGAPDGEDTVVDIGVEAGVGVATGVRRLGLQHGDSEIMGDGGMVDILVAVAGAVIIHMVVAAGAGTAVVVGSPTSTTSGCQVRERHAMFGITAEPCTIVERAVEPTSLHQALMGIFLHLDMVDTAEGAGVMAVGTEDTTANGAAGMTGTEEIMIVEAAAEEATAGKGISPVSVILTDHGNATAGTVVGSRIGGEGGTK